MAEAEWKVETKIKPTSGLGKLLRHHPDIVAQLAQIAAGIATKANAGHKPGRYGIIVQNNHNTKRARVLVHPTDSGGIHLELTEHLMLKAAASSGNKTVNTKPSAQALTMGAKNGDSAGTVVGGTIQPAALPAAP